MQLPKPGRRLRGCIFPIALLAAMALPTDALGARSWQPPIPPPAGFSFGGLGPAVQFDAEGDISTTLKPVGAGPYRYGVRPHAGLLGAPEPFPGTLGEAEITTRFTAQNAAGDLLMWSSAGNVAGFRPAPIYSTAFGPTSFTKVQSLMASTGALKYASLTPSGETFAQTLKGDPNEVNPSSQTFVIFRPAGPNSAFDEGQKIELPPAATDTATEPLGIVADPDGSITAVYRSRPSLRVMQASAAGPNQPFAAATELTLTANPAKWQASAVTRFASSYDGHAILVWGTDRTEETGHKTEIWASRRAPDGTFGPRELVADLDPGHSESDADTEYGSSGVNGLTANPELFPVALDSGATLLAFNRITEGDQCVDPGTADYANGAYLASRDAGGTWSAPIALGADGNVSYSQVEAIAGAGSSVALATTEVTRVAPCGAAAGVVNNARVWQGATPAAPVAIGSSGGPAGTGIAVNPAGDAALVLGSPRVLRVYEDPGTTPEPPAPEPEEPGTPGNPGGGSNPGGSSGSGTPPIGMGPTAPPKVVAPGGIKLDKTLVVDRQGRQRWFNLSIFCDRASRVACTVTATAMTRPAPIKAASGKVAPGRTKALKVYLTPAGSALLKQKGSFKTKIKIVVRAGAAQSSTTKTITVKQG